MSPAPSLSARRFFWAHPQWWGAALAALAWAGLLALHALPQAAPPAGATDHAHMHHMAMEHTQTHQAVSFAGELLGWGLMVLAMMLPLTLPRLQWVAFRSLRQRRHRAMLCFLIGYLAPWMLLGLAAAWLGTVARGQGPLPAAAVFGLAALWMLTPAWRRARAACHRTVPLAPSGWKADRSCMRYGLLIGAPCLASCGPLMLGCALSGHSLVVMLGGLALGLLERRSFRPPTRRLFAGALLLALWALLPLGAGLA